MSGIAAIIRFDGGPVEPGLIEKMTASMSYRGPDGIHHWLQGSSALGQCMLRTTQESLEEAQPLINEDESLVLVMDGWLENWQELRTELLARGTHLRTRADAELVLRAYEIWGRDCLAHLDGDFALVVWDARKRQVFCARDRMGNKPFHYHWDGRRLIVASDLSAILAMPSVQKVPNEGMIAEILAGHWYSRDETLWRGVMRLVAAHHMWVDGDGLRTDRYWSPLLKTPLRYKRDEDYFEHYRDVFADSVRRTSRSHLPVAYEVSGGLDSSAIFCMAEVLRTAGRLPAPAMKGYTWLFEADTDGDEIEYARAVGVHLKQAIQEIEPFRPALSWFASRAREDCDLPPYPNSAMVVSLRKAMVLDGSRVILNGEGGDEWVGGRRLYYAEQLVTRQWTELLQSLREDTAAFGPRQTVKWFVRHGLAHCLPRSIQEFLRRQVSPKGPNNFDSAFWLSANMQTLFGERRANFRHHRGPDEQNPARHSLLMRLNEAFAIHAREQGERTDARMGLEVRGPMYTRQFVELAFATPERLRLRGDSNKYIHTKALQGILPTIIAQRKTKADFSIAFQWQLDKLREVLLEKILHKEDNYLGANECLAASGMAQLYRIYSEQPVDLKPIWELWAIYACNEALAGTPAGSQTRRGEH